MFLDGLSFSLRTIKRTLSSRLFELGIRIYLQQLCLARHRKGRQKGNKSRSSLVVSSLASSRRRSTSLPLQRRRPDSIRRLGPHQSLRVHILPHLAGLVDVHLDQLPRRPSPKPTVLLALGLEDLAHLQVPLRSHPKRAAHFPFFFVELFDVRKSRNVERRRWRSSRAIDR